MINREEDKSKRCWNINQARIKNAKARRKWRAYITDIEPHNGKKVVQENNETPEGSIKSKHAFAYETPLWITTDISDTFIYQTLSDLSEEKQKACGYIWNTNRLSQMSLVSQKRNPTARPKEGHPPIRPRKTKRKSVHTESERNGEGQTGLGRWEKNSGQGSMKRDDAKIDVAYQAANARLNISKQTIAGIPRASLPIESWPARRRVSFSSVFAARARRGGRRDVDKGFNSVRMDQRAKIGREDQARVAVGGRGVARSIDGPVGTMVNFGSNRLIPGFPRYVQPISDWTVFRAFFNPLDRIEGPRTVSLPRWKLNATCRAE